MDNVVVFTAWDDLWMSKNWVCSLHQTDVETGYKPEKFPIAGKICVNVFEHEHKGEATSIVMTDYLVGMHSNENTIFVVFCLFSCALKVCKRSHSSHLTFMSVPNRDTNKQTNRYMSGTKLLKYAFE